MGLKRSNLYKQIDHLCVLVESRKQKKRVSSTLTMASSHRGIGSLVQDSDISPMVTAHDNLEFDDVVNLVDGLVNTTE